MIKNYKNSEDLLKKIEPNSGEWLKGDDKGLLQLQFEEKTIKFGESKTEQVELHVYDLNGNLLASNHDVDDWQVTKPESEGSTPVKRAFLDPHKNIRDLGFQRGEYKFVYNFIRPLIGEYNAQAQLFVKDIKGDKKELVLATNIIENGNETNDEQYIKFKAQIDKFFDIQNRYTDVRNNLDSTESFTISELDNKPLNNKLNDIRDIVDSNVSKLTTDRNDYIEEMARKTIGLRQHTFERLENERLRTFNSDEELMYYYIHEIPNKKLADFRDEIYTVFLSNEKFKDIPVGIDNEDIKSEQTLKLIELRNKELKGLITKFIEDDTFEYMSYKDQIDLWKKLEEKNTKLNEVVPRGDLDNDGKQDDGNMRITEYQNLLQIFKEVANPDTDGDGKFSIQEQTTFTQNIPAYIDMVYDKWNAIIEEYEVQIVSVNDVDAQTRKVVILEDKIRSAKRVIEAVEEYEELYKRETTTLSEEEIEEYIDDARDHIKNLITENTRELTNDEFELIVEPADGYFEFFNLNFDKNQIIKVINIARLSDNEIAVKLYDELPKTIVKKQSCRLQKHILNSYIDNIIIIPEVSELQPNTLSGPNFGLTADKPDHTETEFQSWSELLGNAKTSQQLIDNYFSGSGMGDVKLNINYCEFENFIHFGSATERVENFKYKMELIEFYDTRLGTLNSASLDGSIVNNKNTTIRKRNDVISGFDDWENWLYFNSGSQELSTFSSCGINPWPKPPDRLETEPLTWIESMEQWEANNTLWTQGKVVTLIPNQLPFEQLNSKLPESVQWYRETLNAAQEFDRNNAYGLFKTIPEHIRRDSGNSDYELFVNMIGQHFDIMWSYINQMTAVHSREEHPHEGISDDLLYDVAKSMGWSLTNGNYNANLWEYVLGTDSEGNTQTSGSFMTSKSKEKITKEVWRRQLNNLPYFLKTKGTERSVKAMIACYGVPETILSVKEYGGPSRGDKRPTYNKNQFDYALNITSGSYLQTEWGAVTDTGSAYRYPDSLTLRFKTHNYTEFNYPNYGTHTLLQVGTGSNTQFKVEIEPTGSAGTSANVNFYLSGSFGFATASILDQCIFDDEFTSIMIQREEPTDNDIIDNVYNFYVKKSKWGKLTIDESATIVVDSTVSSSYNNSWTTSGSLYIGQGDATAFTGSVQELRYWTVPLNEPTFNNHVTSIGSYNSNNRSGSYYDLQVRINLVDNIDLTTNNIISSSHPNQTKMYFENGIAKQAEFVGNWGTDNDWLYWEEKQYIEGPSVGGNNVYTDKIRIEGSELRGTLSPRARQEISQYDFAPTDGKRVGIYFSPQNVINDDIMRHMGFFEIDDYIGSPANLYNNAYPELKDIAQEYWKKYSNKNDVAAYMRLFGAFDFSMFKQIKKLLPARANAITGLVIEPNILERNKVIADPKPSKKELDYKIYVPPAEPVLTGEETTHKGEIENPDENVSGTKLDWDGEIEEPGTVLLVDQHDYEGVVDIEADTEGSGVNQDWRGTVNMPPETDNQETKIDCIVTHDKILPTTASVSLYNNSTLSVIHTGPVWDGVSGDEYVWNQPNNAENHIPGTFAYVKFTYAGKNSSVLAGFTNFNIPTEATITDVTFTVSRAGTPAVPFIGRNPANQGRPFIGTYDGTQPTGSQLTSINVTTSPTYDVNPMFINHPTVIDYEEQTYNLSVTALTPAVLNNSNFVVGYQVFNYVANAIAYVNYMKTEVTYMIAGREEKCVTFTDYDYHNRDTVIEMPQEEMLEAVISDESTLLQWKDFSKPTVYCHDYIEFNTTDPDLPFVVTRSSEPRLCQPTESYIGTARSYDTAYVNGYWLHQETDWTTPTSASQFTSSTLPWNSPQNLLATTASALAYFTTLTSSKHPTLAYSSLNQWTTQTYDTGSGWAQPGATLWEDGGTIFDYASGSIDGRFITASLNVASPYEVFSFYERDAAKANAINSIDTTGYRAANGTNLLLGNPSLLSESTIFKIAKHTIKFVPGNKKIAFAIGFTSLSPFFFKTPNVITKTTDAGLTWSIVDTVNTLINGHFYALEVATENNIVATFHDINNGPSVHYSTDGGSNWITNAIIGADPTPPDFGIPPINLSITTWPMLKVAHKDTVFSTPDLTGATWTAVTDPAWGVLNAIKFYDNNLGLAVGTKAVATYSSSVWYTSENDVNVTGSSVEWISDTEAILGTTNGIYKSTDMTLGNAVTFAQIATNGAWSDIGQITFADRQSGFFAGDVFLGTENITLQDNYTVGALSDDDVATLTNRPFEDVANIPGNTVDYGECVISELQEANTTKYSNGLWLTAVESGGGLGIPSNATILGVDLQFITQIFFGNVGPGGGGSPGGPGTSLSDEGQYPEVSFDTMYLALTSSAVNQGPPTSSELTSINGPVILKAGGSTIGYNDTTWYSHGIGGTNNLLERNWTPDDFNGANGDMNIYLTAKCSTANIPLLNPSSLPTKRPQQVNLTLHPPATEPSGTPLISWALVPGTLNGFMNPNDDTEFLQVQRKETFDKNRLRTVGLRNFGFTIPSNAVIQGFEVTTRGRGKSINSFGQDVKCQLLQRYVYLSKSVSQGSFDSQNKGTAGTAFNSTFTDRTFGTSTDLWATTWTAADINSNEFGVLIYVGVVPDRFGPGYEISWKDIVDFSTVNVKVTYQVPGEISKTTVKIQKAFVDVYYEVPSDPDSKIYKTSNGGEDWEEFSNGSNVAVAANYDFESERKSKSYVQNHDKIYSQKLIDPNTSRTLRFNPLHYNHTPIPVGSHISGVEVLVTRKSEYPDTIRDFSVLLNKPNSSNTKWGGTLTNGRQTSSFWSTGSETVVYGGQYDDWGHLGDALWTPNELTKSNFGVILEAETVANPNTDSYPYGVSQVGTYQWINTNNVSSSDENFMYCDLFGNNESADITIEDFEFGLPSTATVTGVEVYIKRRKQVLSSAGKASIIDKRLQLSYDGVQSDQNTSQTSFQTWGAGYPDWETAVYGGPDYLWGLDNLLFAPENIDNLLGNDPNFKFHYAARSSVSGGNFIGSRAEIDSIKLRVYYDDPNTENKAYIDSVETKIYYTPPAGDPINYSYTKVWSGFNFNIDASPTELNGPYNSTVRGVATRIKRNADDSGSLHWIVDNKMTIGTDVAEHTGDNLAVDLGGNVVLSNISNYASTASGQLFGPVTNYSIVRAGWADKQNVEYFSPGTYTSMTWTPYIAAGRASTYGTPTDLYVKFNDLPDNIINVVGMELIVTAEFIPTDPTDEIVVSDISYGTVATNTTSFLGNPITETSYTPTASLASLNTSLPMNTITTTTYGGPLDTWGGALTLDVLNHPSGSFRLHYEELDAASPNEHQARVYTVERIVYYEALIPTGWGTDSYVQSYGSNTTKWGQNFTIEDVNDPEFNFKNKVKFGGNNTANIDEVEMKVYYSYYVTASFSHVQDYVPLGIENHRYNGCKVTSPDINEPSKDTSDNGPVVESTQANPNGLILKRKTAQRGNLDIGEAPIKLRNRR
jgi:hypothetical protein